MPINPLSGLFQRAFSFVDLFQPGQTITRETLDQAFDDFVPALNEGLEQKAAAEAAALAAQGYAEAAATAGAVAGAAAGAEAAVIAAAEQVAEAAAFAGQADAARMDAEAAAASVNPLNLVGLTAETPFAGDLDTLNPSARAQIYRLAAGVTNGPPGAGASDFILHLRTDANNCIQLFLDSDQLSVLYTRVRVSSVWGSWVALATRSGDQALTGGRTLTAVDDGTRTSGSYIPSPNGGNFRRIVNGGAFTLSAPVAAGDYELTVQITNNASAGTITLSGFNRATGDAFTTTNGHHFLLVITKINGLILCERKALQ